MAVMREMWGVARQTYDPDFVFDGMQAALHPDMTLTRASAANTVDYRGRWSSVTTDGARWTHNHALMYNAVSNPWADGAGVGVAPASWSPNAFSQGSLTSTYIGSGFFPDGTYYAEIRVQGTSNGVQHGIHLGTLPISGAPSVRADSGTPWSLEATCELVSGGPFSGGKLSIVAVNSAGTMIQLGAPVGPIITAGVTRLRSTRASVTATGMAGVGAFLHLWPGNGTVVDLVYRIGFPVLNPGSATYLTDTVPLATLATRVNDVATYGLIGLLREPAATNAFLNSDVGVTQNVTTTATAWTFSAIGTGSVTITDSAATSYTWTGTGTNVRQSVSGVVAAGTTTLTVTGDVRECQYEAARFATSYIATVGSPVTRAVDIVTLPTGVIKFTSGTISMRATIPNYGTGIVALISTAWGLYAGSGGDLQNSIYMDFSAGSNSGRLRMRVVSAESEQAALTPATGGFNTLGTYAMSYMLNRVIFSKDGATPTVDTAATMPTPTSPVWMLGGTTSAAANSVPLAVQFLRIWKYNAMGVGRLQIESARTSA